MPDHDELTRLALAAGRGDRAALSSWVRATQAEVWRLLAHLTDRQRADDLTQETYLRAIGSLHRFAGRSSSRTWLLSIARRVVVDDIRHRGARPRTTGADWESAAERQSARQQIGQSSFEDLVEAGILLDGLDPARREALVLTQVLGLSYEQAAAVCGCAVGTIRSRVARARDDLIGEAGARGVL